MTPLKHKMSVFVQICKLILRTLVLKQARKYGVGKQYRNLDQWSYVAPLASA